MKSIFEKIFNPIEVDDHDGLRVTNVYRDQRGNVRVIQQENIEHIAYHIAEKTRRNRITALNYKYEDLS